MRRSYYAHSLVSERSPQAKGGIASGTFKTGQYSKFLPGGQREAYEQSRTDRELLNLTDSVALSQARLHELLTRLRPENPTGMQVAKEWRRFRRAQECRNSA